MDKKLSEYIKAYKTQLEIGDIKVAYEHLVKYVMTIKARFEEALSEKYTCGNVSPGYMDFTYFPFFDTFLRSEKLRFGIVLNHKQMRFELWLMGQNSDVQKRYWALLKSSKWNENRPAMPRYSVLEVVLVEVPDFDDLDLLTAEVIKNTVVLAKEITGYIKGV